MFYRKNALPKLIAALFALTVIGACNVRKKTVITAAPAHQPVKQGQSYSAYNVDVADYVRKYSPYAVKEMKEFGVPASVILGQGIHESGAGKSLLAQEANNHFGVKCTGEWTGPTYHMNDDAPNECFRKYASAEESYDDHMKFLQRKRYASLFTLDKEDYKGWAYGLKRCGYATNPRYSDILISMIERYNLTRFDHGVVPQPGAEYLARHNTGPKPQEASVAENTHQPVLSTSVAAKNIVAAAASGNHATRVIVDTIHQKVYVTDTIYQYAYQRAQDAARSSKGTVAPVTPAPAAAPALPATSGSQPAQVKDMATTSTPDLQIPMTYTVKQGDTLYGIARRYQIKIEDLQKLNNLPDTTVKIDQILRLQ